MELAVVNSVKDYILQEYTSSTVPRLYWSTLWFTRAMQISRVHWLWKQWISKETNNDKLSLIDWQSMNTRKFA